MQRYFSDEYIDNPYVLPPTVYAHCIKVLRSKVGTQFEVVLPNQKIWQMELTKVDVAAKVAVAKLVKEVVIAVENRIKTTIVCGLAKQDKASLVVQKATELGVDKIYFVPMQYSVAKWQAKKAEQKIVRLQKIAQSAAEQSHRTKVPEIAFKASLTEVIAASAAYDEKIVAYEESAKQGEVSQLKQTMDNLTTKLKAGSLPKLLAVFGPEGGIAPDEIAQLTAANFALCGLGPRILRTETAPLYLLAVASAVAELGI